MGMVTYLSIGRTRLDLARSSSDTVHEMEGVGEGTSWLLPADLSNTVEKVTIVLYSQTQRRTLSAHLLVLRDPDAVTNNIHRNDRRYKVRS
jgi:hypothetical protein